MPEIDVSYSRIPEGVSRRWRLVRDVCDGDQALRNDIYLPYLNRHDTSDQNKARNKAYRERAVFYNATGRTRDGLLGLAFRRDPQHEIPPSLSFMLSDVDGAKKSLYQQSQQVLSNVLEVGRHGLYVDHSSRLNRPVIRTYSAESIINWRVQDGMTKMVVLEEREEVDDGYAVQVIEQWRELLLVDGIFVCRVWRKDKDGNAVVVSETVPSAPHQNGRFEFIPFLFVGSNDNDPEIDESPLYDLASVNVAHFRNSADYEDSVFRVGQVQPWISGLTEEWRDWLQREGQMYVGSATAMLLPQGGQFGFAQAQPNMLAKEAMDQKERQMVALGARLLDETRANVTATQNENDKETSTSVLSMCVANVNEAYSTALSWCGAYIRKGFKEDASYRINQEFAKNKIDPQTVTALVAAWQSGAFAKTDLRAYLRQEGVIDVDRSDEDIEDDLAAEGPQFGLMG